MLSKKAFFQDAKHTVRDFPQCP